MSMPMVVHVYTCLRLLHFEVCEVVREEGNWDVVRRLCRVMVLGAMMFLRGNPKNTGESVRANLKIG